MPSENTKALMIDSGRTMEPPLTWDAMDFVEPGDVRTLPPDVRVAIEICAGPPNNASRVSADSASYPKMNSSTEKNSEERGNPYLQRLLELHVAPNAVTVFEVPAHKIQQNFEEILYGRGLEGGIITKAGGRKAYFIVGNEEVFNVVWQSVWELKRKKYSRQQSRSGGWIGWTLVGWMLGFILVAGAAMILY